MEGYEIVEYVWERVGSLPEADMRSRRFLSYLRRMQDDEIAFAIEALYHGALQKKRPYLNLLEAFATDNPLKDYFDNDRLRDVYMVSDQESLNLASEILAPSTPPKNTREVIQGHRDLCELSLGEKKALARGCNPKLLEKLLLEPEPSVVHNLLKHPKIVEDEVLQICARRPNMPEVIEEVWRSRKWSRRYSIRLAIASNPYSPPRLVRVVLASLAVSDVRTLKKMRLFPDGFLDPMIDVMKGAEEADLTKSLPEAIPVMSAQSDDDILN